MLIEDATALALFHNRRSDFFKDSSLLYIEISLISSIHIVIFCIFLRFFGMISKRTLFYSKLV